MPDAALRAVLAHEVKVGDVYATSAAVRVAPDAEVVVKNRKRFVSRGGHKLQGALVRSDRTCAVCGAWTSARPPAVSATACCRRARPAWRAST